MINERELVFGPGIEEYVFTGIDYENRFNDIGNIALACHNIINLAFIYAFSCFQTIVNFNNGKEYSYEELKEKSNSNSRRVLTMMRKVYNECYLSNELMQFILMDIYFDYYAGDDERRLTSIIPGFFNLDVETKDRVILSEYFTMINQSLGSSRYQPFNNSIEEASQKLLELHDAFPFLSTTSLKYDPLTDWYYFDLSSLGYQKTKAFKYKKAYTFGIVERIKAKKIGKAKFCFLSEINENVLKYEDVSQSYFYHCKLSGVVGKNLRNENHELVAPLSIQKDREAFLSYLNPAAAMEKDTKNDKGSSVIEHIYQVNYKYIKNLGLALADAITRESYKKYHNKLLQNFRTICPEAFKGDSAIDWDTILVMLLIELGPSVVLEQIFEVIEDIGFRICKNLISRFGSAIKDKFGRQLNRADDFDELVEEKLSALASNLGVLNNEIGIKRLRIEVKTSIILKAVVEAMSGGSIPDTQKGISRYLAVIQSNEKNDDKYVRSLFEEFLKRIYCFYIGLLAYSKERSTYDSENKMKNEEELLELKTNAESNFVFYARTAYKEIQNIDNIHDILNKVVDLAKDCYAESESTEIRNTAESKYLYSLLGRRYIMNLERWNEVLKEHNIVLSETSDEYWVAHAIGIMRFFTTGRYERIESSVKNFFGATYPIVGNYYKMSKNQDGYDIAMFSLEIDANQNGTADLYNTIGVLSEFEYDLNEQYYCLPNILRSTIERWIDPFVIKCSLFDNIFKEEK